MRKAPRLVLFLLASLIPASGLAQVSYERLLHARQEPHNWLTYSGDYTGQRHSPLTQIHTGNIAQLTLAWVFQNDAPGKFETSPLVIDAVMYVTAPDNHAYALDARTGRLLWRYQRALPERVIACCGRVNRGFAALGDNVFLATLDAHLVALDAKTGNVIWDVEAADYRQGYSFTLAPLAVKDKIVVGVSGGEYAIRGFIDAYEAETGRRAWRFYTIPGPGERGHETWQGDSWKSGGSPAWLTGTYDPELNLIYWPTGNPAPSNQGVLRSGDNLYSNSIVALDADTGALKWHFQFTPYDLHDWDATEIPVLLDLDWQGQPRKLLVQANRNGFFYVLDRASGRFLFSKAFARQTWAREIDPNGRPVLMPGTDPTPGGVYVCPGAGGATNWMSPSYNPGTGLFYVMTRDQCDLFTTTPQPQTPRECHPFIGSTYTPAPGEKPGGALRALDPRTGELRWEFKQHSDPWSGTLSTAGGLVFSGDMEGYFIAFDARTGEVLWHIQTGGAIWAAPITFALDGKQYVAIAAGSAVFVFTLTPIPPAQVSPGTR